MKKTLNLEQHELRYVLRKLVENSFHKKDGLGLNRYDLATVSPLINSNWTPAVQSRLAAIAFKYRRQVATFLPKGRLL